MQLPYMIPLFLGMTFDARTLKPGVDIFEAKYVDDPVEVEFGEYISVYKVATSTSEVQEALDVDGDIAMKIKSGLVDIKGKGSYIKNEDSSKNFVDIVITSRYTSVVKAFKQGAKPMEDWEHKFPMESLGTHFVKEVHYGAELYASAKFIILSSNDTNSIKAEITGVLNTGGNATDLFVNATGSLDLLKKKLSGKVNLEISYYANVPLKSVPDTLQGLEDLIDSFAEEYANTAKGKGAPMAVALEPLSALTEDPNMKDQFRFHKEDSLKSALNDFAIMFDELRETRVDLNAWVKALPFDISPSLKSKISKLYNGILDTLDVFLKALWHLDPTKTREQLNEAFNQYHHDGYHKFNRYRDQLSDLKRGYDNTNVLKDVTGATYIRYGNDNCPDEDSTAVTQGFVFSSAEYGIGGPAKYECAGNSVDFLEELHEEFGKSHIAMIRYPEFIARHTPFVGKEAKKVSGKGIPCTRCHNPYLATVVMFPGKEQCPITWNLLYKGFLVSARADLGLSTEYVCLDEEPSTPKQVAANQFPNYESVAFTTVNSHGSLSSAIFDKGPLRCAVCSINRNLKLFFKGE